MNKIKHIAAGTALVTAAVVGTPSVAMASDGHNPHNACAKAVIKSTAAGAGILGGGVALATATLTGPVGWVVIGSYWATSAYLATEMEDLRHC